MTMIASGNTAQRPTGLTTAAIRFNTSTAGLEVYNPNTSSWIGL
jgi:hypothetical protein